ncbi:hypothetical protein JHC09_13245 [Devosia sp. MC532]|uniref:hypothetical protein n=1 Tax=Devosia sp. MC532 TaxID=2799788 RepID=UPI0018F32E59|nr:hypothetical protein [Devosia sp. MC532]MBJ7578848.1 hypothetical protein [Devosia sp. MC532]
MIAEFFGWVFNEDGTANVRCRLSGSLPLPAESVAVHVTQVTELRDEWVMSVSASVDIRAGEEFEASFAGLPHGLYEISECTAQVVGQRLQKQHIQVSGDVCFQFPMSGSSAHAKNMVRDMRAQRTLHHRATLTTPTAATSSGSHFEMVIFYIDAEVGGLQNLRGVSIVPLNERGDIRNLAQSCARYVQAATGLPVEPNPLMLEDYQRDNPIFAVHIHDVFARDQGDAISFARSYANDFATMVAFERGERPRPAMMFLRDQHGYSLFPLFPRPNRNMIRPMANTHAHMLELYQPNLLRSPSARLVAELFTQALAETDHGFRMFRYWSILETVAVRHIAENVKVALLDGSPILNGKQLQRNTGEKSARVYQYLRTVLELPPQSLATKWSDGRSVNLEGSRLPIQDTETTKTVSLWAQVTAFYKVRNDVAHGGAFDISTAQSDPAQELIAFMFKSAPSVLEDFARAATLSEINLA